MVKVWLTLLIAILFIGITEEFLIDRFLAQEKSAKIHAGSVFDAANTFRTTNITLTVLPLAPSMVINLPENKTFENNESINLEITVTNLTSPIDQFYFNIDNGANITLTLTAGQNITAFDTSFGSHTLTVFANETVSGLSNVSSIDFTVNSSIRFNILFTKFNALSTNFTLLNETELQEITNMTLEISAFGKIEFREVINLTNDSVTDGPLDLDSNVNISTFIFINETILPNLADKNATLFFYNATTKFDNPRVLRNSELCPATICNDNGNLNDTFIVNVTGFTRYDLEETPSVEPTPTPAEAEAAAAAAAARTSRGNMPPKPPVPGVPGREIPEEPFFELPFREPEAEVTPKLILNKSIIIIITLLIIMTLLLEYVKHELHGHESHKKKRKK